MPKQHMIFGRPIPRFTARRLTLLLLGLSILAITLITTLISAVPSSPSLSAYDTKISVPRIGDLSVPRIGDSLSKSALNPFRQPAHPPPSQQNDKYAGSWWWADWKWLSVPFSSSVTLNEDRALLPHLKPRQPIYCYYDATVKKTRDEKDAESELLLTWRRAWWAQGFQPVILSAAEAMINPAYDSLQRLEIEAEVKVDLMRWLAWETMGGGILAHYTLLPTLAREDPMLSYLRRGEYPQLTRWKDMDDALFVGHKDAVSKAIQSMTEPSALKVLKSGLVGAPDGVFQLDESPMPLAAYTQGVIDRKYNKVADKFKQDRAHGLRSLNSLINTHLHVAWQNRFPDGIDVLKPHPEHTTTMVNAALKLARTGVSGPRRVMTLKEIIASEHAVAHSLWLIAENDMPTDMSWYFGFAIPEKALDDGKAQSPVPADRLPKKDDKMPDRSNGPVATEEDLALEPPLLEKARNVVAQTKSSSETRLRASLEAWNMGDTEVWKFVRAFQSRRLMVRLAWEKEEAKYSSGSGTEKGRSAWNRWQDRKGDGKQA
ncbi:hypothetical protein VFPFJ_06750 [Purpureocillium lilacinum]|uniref:Uncharacterized protein n=1 Tax=Purpureocillium lilacinum TaxID=33203 RepID=A0A179HDF8_PURLI|nr:hypothetical protein VFPFJ_06750 [Purpureocillium lilacinum]OAQ80309.1 hypothetical protein VFPBJ_05894 [Purpureocillium lilacinum]OAQ88285.1 hypothetical protein VFPFJ_06750 [Purpureocillium lilacinum]